MTGVGFARLRDPRAVVISRVWAAAGVADRTSVGRGVHDVSGVGRGIESAPCLAEGAAVGPSFRGTTFAERRVALCRIVPGRVVLRLLGRIALRRVVLRFRRVVCRVEAGPRVVLEVDAPFVREPRIALILDARGVDRDLAEPPVAHAAGGAKRGARRGEECDCGVFSRHGPYVRAIELPLEHPLMRSR